MPIRLGGLASGIDTQSIIDTLMKAARQPLVRLEQKQDKVVLKKNLFQDLDDQLFEFRRNLLDLRLESTFKSKTTSSSDERYVTATAEVSAAPGSHVVEVSQIARPAVVRSTYTRASLVSDPPNTSGISSLSGRPTDNLEGTHTITVSDQGSYYRARSEFKPSGGGQLYTLTGTASLESSVVEGTIATSIDSTNNKLNLTVAGETIEVELDSATADVTATAHVAADLEDKINAALNTAKNTQDITYVAVRTTRDQSTGTDRLVIYDVSGSGSSPTIHSTTNSANEALGFGTLASPSGTSGTTTTITTDVTAPTLDLLAVEVNELNTGLIRGVTFNFDSSGISTGEAVVHTNANLNTAGPSPSIVYGGSGVSSSAPLDISAVGLENAGFADAPSSTTNGTFTINNATITIDNYHTLSVNDILGLINGSEAGVTATYDAQNDRFVLTSNENTGIPITLGSATDTSDFLTIANLTANEGASFNVGSSGGRISESTPLAEAGFTLHPTSGTFTINGVTLYVDATTQSLNDVISMINNSDADVIATYDSALDKLSLSSKMGTVDTNGDKIELGSTNDTSNLLKALNLVDELYGEQTSTSAVSGARALDTIAVARTGSSSTVTNVYIPQTQSTGAYQSEAGVVNWVDGIAGHAVFQVTAGDTGTLSSTWTNPLSSPITDIDQFVEHWNTAGNWSTGSVEVGVVKEGPDTLRFFNRSDGAGASGADFTITAPSAWDLLELGLADSAPPTQFDSDSNTLGLWHFNEGTGGTAADASGNGNTVSRNDASWESGSFFYNSLSFDGTNDTASVSAASGSSLYVNGKDQLSVEIWVKPSSASGTTILSKGGDGFELALDSSGHPAFSVWTSAGKQTFTSTAALADDRWYRITATYNGNTSTMKVVVETTGASAVSGGTVSGAGWGTGTIVDSGGDLYIGSSSGTSSWFSGQVDELRISDVERSPGTLGSWSRSVTNSKASVDAEYNALTLAYAVNRSDVVARVRTDGSGYITFYSTDEGYDGGFTVSDEASQPGNTVLDYFGSSSITVEAPENIASGEEGQDAVFTVDGLSYTRSTNSVTDVLGGVTLNLNAPTTTPVTITIANDTDRALDALADFIVGYNQTIDTLNPPILSPEQRKYLDPLTEEDLQKMTLQEYEEYQQKYELYNKYEFIRKESSLRLLYQSLRREATGEVEGLSETLNSLEEIGIAPGSVGGFEDAKAGYLLLKPTGEDDYRDTVREFLASNTELMDALRNHADQVYSLFAAQGSTDGGKDSGIARQMDSLLDSYIGTEGILNEQIKNQGSLDKRIQDLSDQIETEQARLDRLEQRLWDQFTAMEEQLSRLSQQTSAVTALLAKTGIASSQTGGSGA